MSQVESVANPSLETQTLGANDASAGVMVAPTLRVEVLKEEDGNSSSGYSEEEGVLNHGEASDKESESPSASNSSSQTDFIPPDDELKEKIISQVEFYFSDANILKDAFLLKHVRRNKQGFVSLKLITSFRKVKSLTKDYRTVAYSLRQSEQLEVNEDSTKVRRRLPLPDYDETTPSRSVVAVNLPFENPTIESVAELFKPCGDIALIRILRPGKSIPQDVKKHLAKHPELDNVVCAVVEFEQHESAMKAVSQMTNGDDWRKGLRVVLLAQSKKGKKEEPGEEKQTEETGNNNAAALVENTGKEGGKKKRNRKKKGSRVDELAGADVESTASSGSEAEGSECNLAAGEPIERRKSSGAGIPPNILKASLSPNPEASHRLSPSTTPRSSPRNTPRSSPRSSPRGSPNLRRKAHGKSPLVASEQQPSPGGSPESQRRNSFQGRKGSVELGTSPGGSPWVQRRLKAQQEQQGRSPGTSPRLGRRMLDHEGVVRQPKGPDGTTGFYGGAGRGKSLLVL